LECTYVQHVIGALDVVVDDDDDDDDDDVWVAVVSAVPLSHLAEQPTVIGRSESFPGERVVTPFPSLKCLRTH